MKFHTAFLLCTIKPTVAIAAVVLFLALTPLLISAQREPVDRSFVGDEPQVCDTLPIAEVFVGQVLNDSYDKASEIQVVWKQRGCLLEGNYSVSSSLETSIASELFLYGTVEGNVVRFTVQAGYYGVNDDTHFTGVIKGNQISGQYFLPSGGTGTWSLSSETNTPDPTPTDRPAPTATPSSPTVTETAELQARPETSIATTEVPNAEPTPTKRPALTAIPAPTQSGLTALDIAESKASQEVTEASETKKRGFFTNSASVDSEALDDALDPTTLAVIGILLTLVATGIQLFKGN